MKGCAGFFLFCFFLGFHKLIIIIKIISGLTKLNIHTF